MKIKYAVYQYKNGNYYVPVTMPRELIELCNFEHKDRFHVVVTRESISITYSPIGAYSLAKKNQENLVLNLTNLTSEVINILIANHRRFLVGEIKGDSLVIDLSKLSEKPKGFSLFNLSKKGFKNG